MGGHRLAHINTGLQLVTYRQECLVSKYGNEFHENDFNRNYSRHF